MSDIWSGIGVEISKSEGEWLYRAGGEVHGPVPLKTVANRLVNGEITLDTPVAREGGDFHPITRVAAFSQYIPQAKAAAAKRNAAKRRKLVMLAGLLVMLGAAAGGYFIFLKVQEHQAAKAELEKKQRAEEARIAAAREALGDDLKLVALVTLGTEDEVKIKERKRVRPPRGHKKGKGKVGDAAGAATFVSTCQRSPKEILSTLSRHVARLNVCVVEEKKRDPKLPPSLSIEFVVKPEGKVTDFRIDNRHYRVGTLNNCMLKVFRGVRYPSVGGSNCSMTLPLKIGS